MTGRRRLLVVDDHELVRAGLRSVLDAQPDLVVAGEAGTAAEALRLASAQRYDAIVLDVSLPGQSGWEVLEALRGLPGGAPPVLMLSSHREQEFALQALRHGAQGYLPKDQPAGELLAALRLVIAGKRYVGAELAARLAESVLDHADPSLEPHERLTPREFQVFLRIAEGRALVAIGEELHVSPKTVTSWRARILEKLDAKGNADLVAYALRKGLIKHG